MLLSITMNALVNVEQSKPSGKVENNTAKTLKTGEKVRYLLSE